MFTFTAFREETLLHSLYQMVLHVSFSLPVKIRLCYFHCPKTGMINKEFAGVAKCSLYSCKFRKIFQKSVVYLKHIVVYLVHTPKKMQKTLFFCGCQELSDYEKTVWFAYLPCDGRQYGRNGRCSSLERNSYRCCNSCS